MLEGERPGEFIRYQAILGGICLASNPMTVSPMTSSSIIRSRTAAIFFSGLVAGGLGGWLLARPANVAADAASDAAARREGSGRDGSSQDGSASGLKARRQSPKESKEFATAIRSILRDSVEQRRFTRFDSMLERIDVADYATVLSLIRENDLRGCSNAGEWSMVWASWGRRDPASALAFIASPEFEGWNSAAKMEAKNRTLIHWAETDPEAALRHVEASPEMARGDRSLVYGLVKGWANADPKAAAEWIFKSGLGMGGEYDVIVEAISRQGGQEELDEWFTAIQKAGAPAKDIQGFAKRISEVKRAFEPEKAADWLDQNMDEPWVAEGGFLQSTAHSFAERDPVKAMEWAGKTGNESAVTSAMSVWCDRDQQAAGEWILNNPDSPGYTGAVYTYFSGVYRRDKDAARQWAENLPDASLRDKVLEMFQGDLTPGG
jgi:hypothetical protein